jgi:hypothetical protein
VARWIGRFIAQWLGLGFSGFVLASGAIGPVPKTETYEPRFGGVVLLFLTGLVIGYLLARGVPKLRASAPFVGIIPGTYLILALINENRTWAHGHSEWFYANQGNVGLGVVFCMSICFLVGYSLGSAAHAIVRRGSPAN